MTPGRRAAKAALSWNKSAERLHPSTVSSPSSNPSEPTKLLRLIGSSFRGKDSHRCDFNVEIGPEQEQNL